MDMRKLFSLLLASSVLTACGGKKDENKISVTIMSDHVIETPLSKTEACVSQVKMTGYWPTRNKSRKSPRHRYSANQLAKGIQFLQNGQPINIPENAKLKVYSKKSGEEFSWSQKMTDEDYYMPQPVPEVLFGFDRAIDFDLAKIVEGEQSDYRKIDVKELYVLCGEEVQIKIKE